jgi:hypothetical protein
MHISIYNLPFQEDTLAMWHTPDELFLFAPSMQIQTPCHLSLDAGRLVQAL